MKKTRKVMAGAVQIGGGAPVTIQSMTNTDTADAIATADQILALEEAGCEIVRSSVYNEACAKAIPEIKSRIHIPLVADIHFDWRLAIAAMENGVDKLRFNPGNIGGEENVKRLVDCAKAHHVPMRIGVNGGSAEKELLRKYGGPKPEALVESALKHVRMLEKQSYYDMVISIKSSNVPNTIEAYRLMSRECDYPLHIGVTEAGGGEMALVKAAAAMGALLVDGIGDTMRVSMTGDPVQEVYAAKEILKAMGLRKEGVEIVSCPTCGRTKIDLVGLAKQVEERLRDCKKPIKVAVIPLKKNNEAIMNKCHEIKQNLLKLGIGRVALENTGNIGKAYRRHDEVGTPLCITVDFETIENQPESVTVRDRDTMEQVRMPISELKSYIESKIEF